MQDALCMAKNVLLYMLVIAFYTPHKPLLSMCLYLSLPWEIVQRLEKTKVPRSNPCSHFAWDEASCFGIVENRVNTVNSMSMNPGK